MSAAFSVELPAGFLVGTLVGGAYFYAVLQTARLIVAGAPLSKLLPLYVLRCAGALAIFCVAAQQGALPLLMTLAGFVSARFVVRFLTRSTQHG